MYMLLSGVDSAKRDARLLERSMKGMGTKDHHLITRVIRCHWDRRHMANVKGAYSTFHQRELSSRIKSETSGDYERMLLAAIR